MYLMLFIFVTTTIYFIFVNIKVRAHMEDDICFIQISTGTHTLHTTGARTDLTSMDRLLQCSYPMYLHYTHHSIQSKC